MGNGEFLRDTLSGRGHLRAWQLWLFTVETEIFQHFIFQFFIVLGVEPQASCMIGKQFSNLLNAGITGMCPCQTLQYFTNQSHCPSGHQRVLLRAHVSSLATRMQEDCPEQDSQGQCVSHALRWRGEVENTELEICVL
jgi:hypothetical protein